MAATGVGKTVISAFDYKRFKNKNKSAKLLFVTHREEILKQSLEMFRAILKDPNINQKRIFHLSTLYDDYAINERLFHWQTQSWVAEGSRTSERYINHKKRNHQIALFVREYKKENGYAAPYVFLGTADHVSHSGSKPMSFVWRLKEEMPSIWYLGRIRMFCRNVNLDVFYSGDSSKGFISEYKNLAHSFDWAIYMYKKIRSAF